MLPAAASESEHASHSRRLSASVHDGRCPEIHFTLGVRRFNDQAVGRIGREWFRTRCRTIGVHASNFLAISEAVCWNRIRQGDQFPHGPFQGAGTRRWQWNDANMGQSIVAIEHECKRTRAPAALLGKSGSILNDDLN